MRKRKMFKKTEKYNQEITVKNQVLNQMSAPRTITSIAAE